METIRDIMIKNVITISKDKTAYDAAILMSNNEIGSVIVVEDDKIIGIVTERDLVRKVCAKLLPSNKVFIKDIMSKPVITGEPDLEPEAAVQRMLNNKVRRLPIVEDGKLVGIVTITDLAKYLRTRSLIEKIFE
ncbi:MAG: CBS domain-containing protein [Candidatus Nitrosothermus koennekii]|nr:MAG: CBS domain-containing protein [Candidatus Nitrosothermus koennekii]